MISVACPSCGAKYRFDEAKLGGRSQAKVACPKCKAAIEISLPAPAAEPATSDTVRKKPTSPPAQDQTARAQRLRGDEEDVGGDTMTSARLQSLGALELPADKKYSLAVLQGKASGEIFPIVKSRTTIGRAGSDIVLDDSECSRQHAVLEISGSRAVIADLKSTNGTFVEGKKIERAPLENHSEFRVGDHVLMLIITERE